MSAEDIQKYLEGASGSDARALDDHVADCAVCRRHIEEYRILYAGLGDDRAIPEMRDLSEKVMGRLAADRGSERESVLLDFVLAGCGVLLAAIAVVVFVGIGPLAAGVAGFGGAMRDLAVASCEGLRLPVIAGAAAVITLVHIANGAALRRAGMRSRHP